MERAFMDRLTKAVHNSGLTQGEAARRVNERAGTKWTGGYLGRLMGNGDGARPAKRIEPAALFALADVLGVEPRWLWLGEGHMVRVPPARQAGGVR